MVSKHHIKWIVTLILALILVGQSYSQVIDTVCPGDRGSVYGVSGNPYSFFHWNVEGGQIVHDFGDTIVIDWGMNRGTARISVTEESMSGCYGDEVSAEVMITGGPEVDVGPDIEFCQGDSEYVFAYANGEIVSYLWNTGNTSREELAEESGILSVQVLDIFGCSAADSVNVVVNPLPSFTLGNDTTLCRSEGMYLFADNPDYNYLWTCEQWDANKIGEYIVVYQSHYDQEIVVEAVDENSCHATDTIVVYHCPNGLWDIVNVFTPNDDGVDDTWQIRGLGNYPEAEIQVFDRWGRLVFKGEGFTGDETGWDGNDMNGNKLPMDSYHYIINFNNDKIKPAVGSVTIIR